MHGWRGRVKENPLVQSPTAFVGFWVGNNLAETWTCTFHRQDRERPPWAILVPAENGKSQNIP